MKIKKGKTIPFVIMVGLLIVALSLFLLSFYSFFFGDSALGKFSFLMSFIILFFSKMAFDAYKEDEIDYL